MALPGRRPRSDISIMPNEQPAHDTTEAPAPSVALTDTPEFQMALSAALDAKLKPILDGLVQVAAPQATETGAEGLLRQLALAIAEISDQGTNRKRIAPEILAARDKAHKRMIDAIMSAKRAHDETGAPRPLYRAIGKMYLNERFIEPYVMDPASKRPKPVEFYWSGPPNPLMRPLNAPATDIFRHYSDSLGSIDTYDKKDTQAWVTAGGLVIKGEAAPRSIMGRQDRPAFDDDLAINNDDPESDYISVLGTVQPPARRSSAGIGKGAI